MRRLLIALLAAVLAPAALAADQPGPVDYGPLPVITGMTGESRIEPRFSRAAALVAGGRRVEVRCWSLEDWQRLRQEWLEATEGEFDLHSTFAYVNPNDPEPRYRVHLSSGICLALSRLTYQRAWAKTSQKVLMVRALVQLAHEAQHIRGTRDEATAECHGMQRARSIARSLGLTLRQANEIGRLYLRFEYPLKSPLYRSRECRQGGALDLNLAKTFP